MRSSLRRALDVVQNLNAQLAGDAGVTADSATWLELLRSMCDSTMVGGCG